MKMKIGQLLKFMLVIQIVLLGWSSARNVNAGMTAEELLIENTNPLMVFQDMLPAAFVGTFLDESPVEPNCALLDSPSVRGLMSGMLETKMLHLCGRQDELGGQVKETRTTPDTLSSVFYTDVQVNNSGTDVGDSTTQSETAISISPETGTICIAYNDSQHWANGAIGFHGFSRSTNNGATFVDRGAIPAGGGGNGFGDPSLVWRQADGYFYYAALHTDGLALWRSTDDCQTFAYRSMIHVGGGDDKELMVVDNNPTSPYFGRIYVAWTDFAAGARIYITHSDDGTVWSTPVVLSGAGIAAHGAWPAVDPVTGDVYVSWVRWNPYPTGPIDIQIVRSATGGATWGFVTNPLTGAVNPRDVTATSNCDRPALNRDIRYLPSPQLVVDLNRNLHVVYSYDPDGYGSGDVVNVYYRRSTDQGATWEPEVRLNDDSTTTDQWFPTVSVGPSGVVAATWYDRRNDVASNRWFDYYKVFSNDNGLTWGPNIRVSDVSSDVPTLNPNFDPAVATCYHGDYDQQVQVGNYLYTTWSDDRNIQNSHPDPDIWFEREPVSLDYGKRIRILFDETHGVRQGFYIDDWYAELADFLRGYNHLVDALKAPAPFNYTTISQYDVLALLLPTDFYSTSEKDAIAQFVTEGRRLVTIGEYGSYAGVSNDILNAVHAHLGDGIVHNDDEVFDPTDYEVHTYWPLIHNFLPDPVNTWVVNVLELAASSLHVSGPAYGTAFGDNDTYTVPTTSINSMEDVRSDGLFDAEIAPSSIKEKNPPLPDRSVEIASPIEIPYKGTPGPAAPRLETEVADLSDNPHKVSLVPTSPGAGGLLYLTSLDSGNSTFAVYDPGGDAWTTLNGFDTTCQMAASASGDLYALEFSTAQIKVYDPYTDTWSFVMSGPPIATGAKCNLEITNDGEFFYTEYNNTTLYYTTSGTWNTFVLPFLGNAMGDYDPTTDQYVVGEYYTVNAHMIDVHTLTITDFSLGPGNNNEYARFSSVMGNRYYYQASTYPIYSYDLSNPAQTGFDHGVSPGFYTSSAADRSNNIIYVSDLDGDLLYVFDPAAGTLDPLATYVGIGNHSSLAFVPGYTFENFPNTWDVSTIGLLYDQIGDDVVYAHESDTAGAGLPTIYGVDYSIPHNLLYSRTLSTINGAWPPTLNNRNGIGHDVTLDTFFLPDYQGDLSIADDNIIETTYGGVILNAWETDGAGNDSYDGSFIDQIIDIAVIPGTAPRYFVAAGSDGSLMYEIDLIKAGWWAPNSWGTINTCTVPGLTDNVGIDYDAVHNLLFHSDWISTNIVVTDLNCNVLQTFTCNSPAGFNTGVTFIEGKSPPEIWVTDYSSNSTTRCEAVLPEPPIVQAMSSIGAGDVFAIGDANLWTNLDTDGNGILNFYEYNNSQLAWNVFAYGQVLVLDQKIYLPLVMR